MGVKMFVCLLVCGGLTVIQSPTPIWKKSPPAHLTKEGFGAVLTPDPLLPEAGGPETLKAQGHIFENCLIYKRC